LILDDKTACLTDFGRSRIVNDSDGTNPAIAGSIRYSAPEILGLDDVDEPSPFPLDFQAADVYSLAMVMLEVRPLVLA
jgi:serine/threonine protein kinase